MQLSIFDEDNSDYEEIILSLQEQYFNKIVNGQKSNEYRFNFLKSKSKAYIYLPKNKQQIVGVVYLGEPNWKDRETASKIYSEFGDGEYSVMFEWLKDKKGCYVIPIEKYIKFKNPITKDKLHLFDEFVAPQTYLLLKNRPNLKKFLNGCEREQENENVK